MLRIKVYEKGTLAKKLDLSGAYLLGNDRVPLKAALKFVKGEIVSDARARGAAALSIPWPVEGLGRMMLETPRLQERTEPYNLSVELARGQMMRISQKREEWGLYDFPDGESIYRSIDHARNLLIEAMTAPDEISAAERGEAAIAAGVAAGEAVSAFHADVFLQRRRAAGQFIRRPLGCRVDPTQNSKEYLQRLIDGFDFAILPFCWSSMEPKEGTHKPSNVDPWLRLLHQHEIPIWGSPLLSMDPAHLPDWLRRWSRNYDRFRDCVTRHIRHVLKSYGPHVQAWEAISGVHARNTLGFTFEQIMDLTRVSSLIVKQMAPKSLALIGLTLPWGEYYARDSRTIPPLLYAEMSVQSGINFDGFGLDIRFGDHEPASYVRDMMQVSSLLDRFGTLGKPLHITAAGVPSAGGSLSGGVWHAGWSEPIQAEWLREFCRAALSKPFVETVTCNRLADGTDPEGVLDMEGAPKPAYQVLLDLKREITAEPTP